MHSRDTILSRIRKLTGENAGAPPGVRSFAAATGITQSQWRGVFWAKWSDALAEAGFAPNQKQERFDSDVVVRKLVELTDRLGKVPTFTEMRLERRTHDPSFPNDKTVANHFGSVAAIADALRTFCGSHSEFAHLLVIIPNGEPMPSQNEDNQKLSDGLVYLLHSGDFYKIGRSDTIERRVKEISIALPQAVTLVHAIRSDDPAGIEAYWHKRFADRRANGEWFKLTRADIAAFKRRKYQ